MLKQGTYGTYDMLICIIDTDGKSIHIKPLGAFHVNWRQLTGFDGANMKRHCAQIEAK